MLVWAERRGWVSRGPDQAAGAVRRDAAAARESSSGRLNPAASLASTFNGGRTVTPAVVEDRRERRLGLEAALGAEVAEPAVADGDVADLVGEDPPQHGGGGVVAGGGEALDHRRVDVEAAGLEHPGHQRHAPQRVVGGAGAGVPQPAVGGQVAVVGAVVGSRLAEEPKCSASSAATRTQSS